MQSLWRKPASPLIAAGVIFALLVADILIAKIQVMSGIGNPVHVGEVGQFVLLLIAIVLFVAGTLGMETLEESEGRQEARKPAGNQEFSKPESNKIQGGNRNA